MTRKTFPNRFEWGGNILSKCEWLCHGSWRPRLNRREKRENQRDMNMPCPRLPGLLRYKWVFVSFSHRCGHCRLLCSDRLYFQHEPKSVCPEVVSYRVFGKKQWQKPLIFSIIMCHYSKPQMRSYRDISVSSEYLGKAHSYWTCPCVWCYACTEPTPVSCIEK